MRRGGVLVLLALAVGGCGATHHIGRPRWLLPDLRQDSPWGVDARAHLGRRRTVYRLVFASTVRNVGAGPLVVVGTRPSTARRLMRMDQVVVGSGGRTRDIVGVGHGYYSVPHAHWHFVPFEQYELRRLDGSLVARDHKVGFCIGTHLTTAAVLRRLCAHGKPKALYVRENLQPHHGDTYGPEREGQYIDIDGVPAGIYDVVHRVNIERRIRESDYANDVASLRVRLRWLGSPREPLVTSIRACPSTARC